MVFFHDNRTGNEGLREEGVRRSSIVDSVSPLSEALSESGLEAGDLADKVSDGVREGLLGTIVRGGLDP